MTTRRAVICNKKGLHARAAAKLVKTAASFDAEVTVTRLARHGSNEACAGATSILSLLMLGADITSEVDINGTGTQARDAVDAIVALIERRFDEEE